MKRFLLAPVLALLFFSCLKSSDKGCQPVSPASEASKLASFCTGNGIDYKVDSASGIYYQILAPGAGDSIRPSSKITIAYKGTLLDNTVFDQSQNATFLLSDLIPGWQIGIRWVRKNGHIKLVIPSSLAYGCLPPSSSIPVNAPLYFDITVNDVQ